MQLLTFYKSGRKSRVRVPTVYGSDTRNNLLYKAMSVAEFETLLKQLLNLLRVGAAPSRNI